MTDFAQLGVSERLVDRLKVMGIAKPTPVQAETIPIVYQNKDVISQAQTGTGKTLAFVLPMLDKIRVDQPHVQGLILTPTRELAIQITAEVKKLLDPNGSIKVLAVYGGQDVEAQLHKLKGHNHIVVATPGRLLDHLRRETISLADIRMLVLDEADQMLHMGFLTEVDEILRQTPYKKQVMLFSATMPPKIREMAGRILRSPEHVTVKAERVTVKDIRQWLVETTDRGKQDALVSLLEATQPYLSIIFCRTKRRASTLNLALQELGYDSDELHGDLSQAKREQVMKRFRDAKLQLLVATDVAARGLDVEGVTHVFNYDVPQDVESYIHRIGRTGRAGEKGLAITLFVGKDKHEVAAIEDGIEMALERRTEEGASLGGGGLETSRVGGGFGRGGGGRNAGGRSAGGQAGRGRAGAGDRGGFATAGRGGRGAGGSGAGRSGGRGESAGRGGRGESAGQAKGRNIAASKARSAGGRDAGFGGSEAGRGGRAEREARGGAGGFGGAGSSRGRDDSRSGGRSEGFDGAGAGRSGGSRSEGYGGGAGAAGRGRSGAAGKAGGRPPRGGGDPNWSVASPPRARTSESFGGGAEARESRAGRGAPEARGGSGRGASGASIKQRAAEGRKPSDERVGFGRPSSGGPKGGGSGGFRGGPGGSGGGSRGAGGRPANKRAPRGR
ncbi:DEAD/DEAH box helicase [Cohnella yongneupensis]|uniref:DEAD/DEAH box helicase n=1 Tax=Cohnella yongneupensis TaxID=425006 RepID=A0ABW0QXK6_9BACL